MNDLELSACTSFVDWVKNFLGNRLSENKELVEKLLKGIQDIGANKSIKVHVYIAMKISFRTV